METDDDKKAWRKAMRFCAMWQEAIVRSRTISSSAFTLGEQEIFERTREVFLYFDLPFDASGPDTGGAA